MKEALIGAAAGGLAAAAALYLFDPIAGRGRRAHLRDKWVRARHEAGEAIDIATSDARNRLHGLEAELRARLRPEHVDDEVLLERVRATLGHCVSHPGPIHVEVRAGLVTLRGPILTAELPFALGRIRAVRGVHGIDSQLEPYQDASHVPALQGAGKRPLLERAVRNWSPSARLLAGIGGGLLVGGALFGQRRRLIRGLVGTALLGRAAVNEIVPPASPRQRARGRFDVPTPPSPAPPEASS